MTHDIDIDVRKGIKQAAFFDLEKTLTPHASEQECALAMARQGHFPITGLARVLLVYLKYNLGLISNFEEMKRFGARVFAGRDAAGDIAHARALFASRLGRFIYPEALAWVRGFQQRGFSVYIVSSTYRFIVEPYAAHLGVDRFFGPELEVVDGRCTGNITGTIYHQQHKAAVLEEAAQLDGVSLEHSYAFGDSVNDQQMLEKVGHPVVVNPGRKLRAVAEGRGWPVVRWSMNGAQVR